MNQIKSCISLLIVIYYFSGCNQSSESKINKEQSSFKLIKSKINELELPKGEFSGMVSYTDKQGSNIVFAVKREYTKSVDIFNDGNYVEFAKANFQIINYSINDSIMIKKWVVIDSVDGGQWDANAEIIKNTLQVTDLDNDSVAEIWFAYKIGSRSDLNPITMNLIMFEGNNKYYIKGNTMLDMGNGVYYGGDNNINSDKSFKNCDLRFKSFALKLWDDNALENQNEESMPSRFADELIWNLVYPKDNKFDSEGHLIIKTEQGELKTYIGRKYTYNNKTKLAVVFFTFQYYNGVKEDGHASKSSIRIAYFDYNRSTGYKLSSVKDWLDMPQEGYGIEPPIEMKSYNNKPCFYVKYDQDQGYEYYYEVETLKKQN